MKIILFGAPGSGKGTQASYISERLGIPAVSTGNLIRDAIASGHANGPAFKRFIDQGKLVPDEMVISLLAERLSEKECSKGCILDGFPRTVNQAERLSAMGFVPDLVISLEVPDEVIEARAVGRRVCPICGLSYHLTDNKPIKEGVCDKCNVPLVIRKDDEPETVRKRLQVFHEQTADVKAFYEASGLVRKIDASSSVDNTQKQVRDILESYNDQH
ncbi:MAG TPA: nucleoside monophosphate kinase [Clostridiales bacterium]|jgi:adenylate kinase|nr:nucleoside monophosphate kinase [Clostridiales bacterium]